MATLEVDHPRSLVTFNNRPRSALGLSDNDLGKTMAHLTVNKTSIRIMDAGGATKEISAAQDPGAILRFGCSV